MSEPPKIQSIQSVVDITNRILLLNAANVGALDTVAYFWIVRLYRRV
jgi:hypothetical protein